MAIPEIDLGDPATWQDLPGAVSAALQQGPVARSKPTGSLVVLAASECERLLRDPRVVAAGTRTLELAGVTEGIVHDWWKLILFQTNPPTHDRLRALLNRAFTPRRSDAMRPRVREIAGELIDAALADGELDVTGRFAHEIPVRIISEMLGVPEGDHPLFGEWANDLGLAFSPVIPPETLGRIETALRGLYGYVDRLVEQRRAAPTGDLISALIVAEEGSDRLSDEELRAMVVNLIFAGHDTTKGLISVAVKLLCEHPEQFELLRADPDLAPTAVEEILRFEPPVMGVPRVALEDLEIAGEKVAAGEFLALSIISANRDPAAVADPDRFDITRGTRSHLSFGRGLHFCLGAALARAEADEALRALARCPARLEAVDPPVRWVPFAAIRRLESLRLQLGAGT